VGGDEPTETMGDENAVTIALAAVIDAESG
jgi:hypothetical protein